MEPNEYEFWRELLLGKGFKEPYFTNLKFLTMGENDYPIAVTRGYFLFVRGNCKVGICEADLERKSIPEVYISYDMGKTAQSIWARATKKDMENIEQVIDATINHDLLPLCVGISWAAPLLEKLLNLETTCLV